MSRLAIAVVIAASSVAAADSHVIPMAKRTGLQMDKRVEAVHGDRTKPGEPFVIRIHAEAGYIIMPHTHPIDENIVVIDGTWAFGMGDRYRKDGAEVMEVGAFALCPKGMQHFAVSRTATIIQVHGLGPFTTTWVTPVFELTDHGAVKKTGAEDPGTAATAPAGCFALALGAHVKGKLGDGTVVGAQCTPNQLTQYRVEKSSGERFWAQRDELEVPRI